MKAGLHSLQLRFLKVVVLGAVAFAALAGVLAYRLGDARASAAASRALDDLASAVEKTAAIGAYARDPLLLKEVADGLSRNALVSGVDIREAHGETSLLNPNRSPPGAGQEGVPSTLAPGLTIDRALHSPFDRTEVVGRLHIVANMAYIASEARVLAWTFALLMVSQTAVMAFVIYVVGARIVSLPIVHLAQQLRRMRPGEKDRLQTPRGHDKDEIGVLVAAGNTLLQANEDALERERTLRSELAVIEAQYRQIFDSTSAGIFVLDKEGRLINGNPTVLKVCGLAIEDMRKLRGQDFLQQVFARPDRVQEMVAAAAERGETVSADLELRQGAGQVRWVHCLISVQDRVAAGAASPVSAAGGFIEGVMYDITERKRAEHAVQNLADHDALTGLKSRAATVATLDRFIADAQAAQTEVTIFYIDLDGFKGVNDTLGHKAGDEVLVQCGQRMIAAVRRSSDLIGRLGGDEFLVALYNTGPASPATSEIAALLLNNLRLPLTLESGARVSVGASIGIGCYPVHGSDSRQIMHLADEAMYAVKRSGKNAFAMAVPVGERSLRLSQ